MFIISPSAATPSHVSASRMSSASSTRARVLEAGQRGDARRHGEQDLEREPAALLEHPADAVQAEHVGDLVVVDEDGRRAVREDRLGEPRDRDHRGLDVQVGVDQAGHEVRAVGVEDLGVRPARVAGVAEHRDPPVLHRHVDAVVDLARVDVDEPAAGDQQVGGRAAHADVGEGLRGGGERCDGHGWTLWRRTSARSAAEPQAAGRSPIQ